MTLQDHKPLLYAVLIDADNVPVRFADAILKEITRFGEPGLRRVYGDWSQPHMAPWISKIRELGLVAHQQSANTTGKNASDIGLVIDAMDVLHSGHFDGFVLVSSDSDFTRLASRIREQGLDVIGIGEAKTPESLRNACKRFILLENLAVDDEERKTEGTQKAISKEPPSKAVPLIRKAMNSMNQEEDWFSLGPLGQALVSTHPDFDTRTYGSIKLSDLLKKTGHFEVQTIDGSLKTRRIRTN